MPPGEGFLRPDHAGEEDAPKVAPGSAQYNALVCVYGVQLSIRLNLDRESANARAKVFRGCPSFRAPFHWPDRNWLYAGRKGA